MESFRRRHLPHYDVSNATYFVTACLAGSIPATGLLAPHRRMRPVFPGAAGDRSNICDTEDFRRAETWLDAQAGVRWLADRRLAAIVHDEITRAAGDSIDLHAFVIMPNHMHLVFTPRRSWVASLGRQGMRVPPRAAVMRSIKGRSGLACNRVLRRGGAFWQSESYDRVVRDAAELDDVVQYVEHNPVKAGLCARAEEWEFSSAWRSGA